MSQHQKNTTIAYLDCNFHSFGFIKKLDGHSNVACVATNKNNTHTPVRRDERLMLDGAHDVVFNP
jgi:hypothetical protein